MSLLGSAGGAAVSPGLRRFAGRYAALVALAWLLFAVLVVRFIEVWANAMLGLSLPVLSRTWFTVLFTGFALVHGTTLLGLGRALAFMAICAAVTWSFEEIGILTGAVYGIYHYSDQLGVKLGEVPLLIPFAWFMMVYASWIVASLLLEGMDYGPRLTSVLRAGVAALAMTSWDTVMDPGMARAGVWTWENGGAYFGVPLQNFVGWLITTLIVYAAAEIMMCLARGPAHDATGVGMDRAGLHAGPPGLYAGLPAVLYGLIAVDRLLLPDLPELRVVAAFGMCVLALLACLRALSPGAASR